MFDPRYPDTSNSLNRVVLVDLPGLDVPHDVKGKTGYELVSTAALDKLIEKHIQDLGLWSYTSTSGDREIFFVMFDLDDPIAIQIVEIMGRNLGYLLLTLIRGDDINRKARSEWSDAHWKLWGGIRTVHLGGGLVTGEMGKIMLRRLTEIIESSGANLDVDIAPYSHILPLVGSARSILQGNIGYVFDFGGTYIKSGIASFDASGLVKFQQLPMSAAIRDDVSPKVIRAKMVNAIVETVKHADFDAHVIPISIAAYVDAKGQPLIAQGGIYMQLARLSDDVPAMLSELVSKRIGKPVTIQLLHDGSAAASFYAPEENAAVLMLGTAIGSGYCVPRPELRAVSPHLSIAGEHGG